MAPTTRTLNPLPFQDLEPHRFEDLVRQLVYDFRLWRNIEAVGRSGSDEGIDIRGIERPGVAETEREDLDEEQEEAAAEHLRSIESDRVWVVQCKRERAIGPGKVRKIIKKYFELSPPAPYGYILAAASDFSQAARDAAAEQLRRHGVQEFYVWGKGELEDQLFQPKNDHLLFAYFGISLQVRRRSQRTTFRSHLALKKKLIKEIGNLEGYGNKPVLIRDPRDEEYPQIISPEAFAKRPKWRYYEFYAHEPPDHTAFVNRKMYAYANFDTGEWDALEDYDVSIPSHPVVWGADADVGDWDKRSLYDAFWEMRIEPLNQAWMMQLGTIAYDRILLCDEIGDSFNDGPHLIVEWTREDDPFDLRCTRIEWAHDSGRTFQVDHTKRIPFFPKPLPDLREERQEKARKHLEDLKKPLR